MIVGSGLSYIAALLSVELGDSLVWCGDGISSELCLEGEEVLVRIALLLSGLGPCEPEQMLGGRSGGSTGALLALFVRKSTLCKRCIEGPGWS